MKAFLLLVTFVSFTCHARDVKEQEPNKYTITFFDIPQALSPGSLTDSATVKKKKNVKEEDKLNAVKAETPSSPQVPQSNLTQSTVVTSQPEKSRVVPVKIENPVNQSANQQAQLSPQLPANQTAGQQPAVPVIQATGSVPAQAASQQNKAPAASQNDTQQATAQQAKAQALQKQNKTQATVEHAKNLAPAQQTNASAKLGKEAALLQAASSPQGKALAASLAHSEVGELGEKQQPKNAKGGNAANLGKTKDQAQLNALKETDKTPKKVTANLVPLFKPANKHDHSLSFQKGSIKHPEHTIYPECHQCPENSTYSSCIKSETLQKCNKGLNNICYTRSIKDSNVIKYEMGCADHNLCLGAKAFPCRDSSDRCFTCCQWNRCNSNPHGGEYELDGINFDESQKATGRATATHSQSLTLTIGAIILQAAVLYLLF